MLYDKIFCVELIGKGSYQNIFPICCCTGNKSIVDTINSTKMLTEKRLQVDICITMEMINKKVVKQIIWCDSRSQLSDCLTKVLPLFDLKECLVVSYNSLAWFIWMIIVNGILIYVMWSTINVSTINCLTLMASPNLPPLSQTSSPLKFLFQSNLYCLLLLRLTMNVTKSNLKGFIKIHVACYTFYLWQSISECTWGWNGSFSM